MKRIILVLLTVVAAVGVTFGTGQVASAGPTNCTTVTHPHDVWRTCWSGAGQQSVYVACSRPGYPTYLTSGNWASLGQTSIGTCPPIRSARYAGYNVR